MNELPPPSPLPAAPAAAGAAYRVLARKYRPADFSQLIGQEALVRTLSNAIASGRIAQAFMLTGVRGVGKTTTARIIARALNCIGPDGTGGPTASPCGVCDACLAIAQDRHVDVMEMDAASHTGVGDIREIIAGVRYSPVSARFKLYIIDEVHMLSNNAFNALLKTLEEPPSHVKFVFATTEIRKVPITVLSRCQRFDLRRVPAPVLIEHFRKVAEAEGIAVESDALAMIARAADGSVRDGLSLLDQAIALGGASVSGSQVRDMLGLADRVVVIDLFEAAVTGRPRDALDVLGELHRSGADPSMVLRDLLEFSHFLTRFKLVPEIAGDPATPEAERVRGGDLAQRLSLPALARVWQILLKGMPEVQSAPVPQQALEMVVIRLAYAADLPPPGDLIKQFQGQAAGNAAAPGGPPAGPAGPRAPTALRAVEAPARQPLEESIRAAVPDAAMPAVAVPAVAVPAVRDFRALVQLFADRKEGVLYGQLHGNVHPVRLEPGCLEIRLGPGAPTNLPSRVSALLTEWTGRRWIVAISDQPGGSTLKDEDAAAVSRARAEAEAHPLVRAVLETFPGARITDVRDLATTASVEDSTAAGDHSVEDRTESIDDEGDF
ncbi:MAG: DNA polymerase III subunit gamma/tau [Azospirillum sp.]|nr:DNA polymerase III subunit gamma/tau [Azospirillum sp.]